MNRSYFEHVESHKRPEAVTWEIVIFESPDAGIKYEVIEHDIPPPELARLIAETHRSK